MNIDLDKIVFISEYTGGGFGSKITGGLTMIIPALLSSKLNAPVMMRMSREEEHCVGRARPSVIGRMKVGFAKDGRITALDMFTVCNSGAYDAQGDGFGGADRVAAVPAGGDAAAGDFGDDNTPPRSAQSAPGGMQGIAISNRFLPRRRDKLGGPGGHSPSELSEGKAEFGPAINGKRAMQQAAS